MHQAYQDQESMTLKLIKPYRLIVIGTLLIYQGAPFSLKIKINLVSGGKVEMSN